MKNKDVTYSQLLEKALVLKEKYAKHNKEKRGSDWSVSDYMAGFVGDVGDLSKLIMAKQGLRHIDNVDSKIAHELADCLWSILVIADMENIDLAQEFGKTMNEVGVRIDSGQVS